MEYILEELLITGLLIHIFHNTEIRLFSLIRGFFHKIHIPYNDDEYWLYIIMITICSADRERG